MSNAVRQTGKIISRSGRNYSLAFDGGGRFSAESDTQYPVGVRVDVLAGIIVARAGVEQKIKYYQV